MTETLKPGDAIPDRVSADKNSPDWPGEATRMLQVKLNGALVDLAYAYCISEGWVDIIQKWPDGRIKMVDDKMWTLRIRGNVEVNWRSVL